MTRSGSILLLGAAVLSWSASSTAMQASYEPARLATGTIPGQPPLASTGAVVVVELEVAPSGIVTDTIVIDDGPPYTEAIQKAARTWRFHPARENGAAVFGKAVVIGVFRPPVLMGGELPERTHVREPSNDVPYPTMTATPTYPPTALYEGITFLEVEVGPSGAFREVVLHSADEAYDTLAIQAAREFRFRPARRDGRSITSYALVLFGFRQPITSPTRPRR